MITKITGLPVSVVGDVLTLAVGAFEYEILIPEFARRRLQEQIGREVSLHTIEYLEGNAMQGRLIPRLVGFTHPMEREFFDLFCEVDGVGVKKALRAMVRPVQEVAAMIEELYSHYDRPTTATLMGHARGVILLAAAQAGIPAHSYPSTQIKKTLTGNGHAAKWQIQSAVRQELGLPADPEPPDVADALAIALCHCYLTRHAAVIGGE